MRLILIVGTVISCFQLISLVFFRATRKTYAGFGHWTAGVGLLTLGYLALALRGFIPDTLSIFVGNVAFCLGMVLALDGLRRFMGLGPMSRLWYAIPGMDLVAVAVLYYLYDSAFWRTAIMAIATSAPQWPMAALVFCHPVKHKSMFYPVIGCFLGLSGLVVLVRPIGAYFLPQWHSLMDSPFLLGSVISLIVLQLGETLSWMMLNSERVESELAESESDQRLTVDRLQQALAEQKRSEEALRKSEERYRTLVENVDLGISLIDSDHNIIMSNTTISKWYDKPASELRGKKCYQIFRGVQSVCLNCHGVQAMTTGMAAQSESDGLRSDGARVYVRVQCFPIVGSDGQATGFIEVVEDITERKEAEEALRESEELYRAVFSNSAVGISVTDKNGKFIDSNSALLKTLGRTQQELESVHFADFTHPDDVEISRNKFGALVRGEMESYTIEKRYIRKDGETAWVDLSVAPILDRKGVCVATFGVTVDITERKRSEEELREANDVFHTFADQLPAKVFIKDHNSRLQYINKYVRDVHASEDWIGRDASEYFPPEVSKIVLADEKKVLLNGPIVIEEWITDKKGVKRLWETRKFPIHREGKPPLLGGVSIDITDRRQAEETLRESRERLELAVGGADLGLWDWNLKTGRAIWDERAMEMMGYRRDEVEFNLGFWKSSVHPEDWPKVSKTLNQHMEGRLPLYETEYRLRCKSGDWKWILARGKVVGHDTDGKPLRMVGTSLDITQRKSAEEERERLRAQLLQAQKMEAMGTLAGGVAHDFNNLLTVVTGFSELLLAEKDPKQPEYADLQKIFQAARSGADLVQRLLMFSRKAEPKPVPMSLNKQIVHVEKLLRRTIPRMIDIKLELTADLSDISADMSQMEQVLMNLAVNARDAMADKGTLTIATQAVRLDEDYCRLHVDAKPGEYVLLEISDNGQGMDKKTIGRIFEPFFTTKEMGRGTGLGLATVYGIVSQYNGHIAVDSELGKGTTFKVYLPAIPADAEPEIEESNIISASGTETVLLVDDEEFVRQLGARILSKQGYTVLQAVNGREALDLFKQERSLISLVILDLIMPEMGGMECLKELLRIDPQAKVLVTSGYSADGSVSKTIKLGAKGFVTKPFRVKELLRDVRQLLDEAENPVDMPLI